MQGFIQVLIFIFIGIFLLLFGWTLFARQFMEIRQKRKQEARLQKVGSGTPGESQVCPICSSVMQKGESLKTVAFPSITGGNDRLMHIQGCLNCLSGKYQRKCPVCGALLEPTEVLIARMFERRFKRPHIHVLGCNKCRNLPIIGKKH